jgi:hypothetical protein
LLAFAAVHGHFHRVAVFAAEGFVHVQERLHVVFARRQFAQAAQRVAKLSTTETLSGVLFPALHVHAVHLCRFIIVAHLKTRLGRCGFGKNQQQTPLQRRIAFADGVGEVNPQLGGGEEGTKEEQEQETHVW